jgi:hypothetical protein
MTTTGFENFKKSLEDYLQKIEFIYSGDVINSIDKTFTKKIKHTSFSAELMREVMVDVYNYSFKEMLEKSKEIVIHRSNFIDIHDMIDKLSINPKLLFFSNHSNRNLSLGHTILDTKDSKLFLPDYFVRKFRLMSSGVEVSSFYSPLIKDSEDDCHFYLVDKPIQSMVWSLQNMTYDINKGFSSNLHSIKLPIYNCDYSSLRIRVINTQKLREEKINSILYDS